MGMRAEPMTREVLMKQSELLGELRELFMKQLEETKGLQQVVSAIGFAMDKLMKQMSWMEEGSGNRNDRVRSI